jgi:hypothetical protein
MKISDPLIRNYCYMMLDFCSGWLINDEDGLPMIHFLGQSMLETIATLPEGPTFYRDVLRPAESRIDELQSDSNLDEHLREKYVLLGKYFQKYIGPWRS